jgi:hypothetical protein
MAGEALHQPTVVNVQNLGGHLVLFLPSACIIGLGGATSRTTQAVGLR